MSSLRRFINAEREVLFAFVTTRLLICAIGWFAYEAFPHSTEHGVIGSAPWQFLFRWDAVHYYEIATSGYSNDPTYPTVPFFPLLPLCLRLLALVTRGDVILIGFVFCNALLLAAAILLRRLLRLDFPLPSRVPERTVWLFLLAPMTFFFSAIYTESLFLLLVLAAIWCARQRKWFVCGMIGILASATRPNAMLLLVPLLVESFGGGRSTDEERGRGFWRSALWLVLFPIGFIAYAAYLQLRFGDALAFWHAQAWFTREALPPWEAFRLAFTYPPPDAALFIVTAFVAVALCIVAFRKVRLSYALFACAMTVVCLSSTWYALPRYLSVVFPFYAVAAVLTERSEPAFFAVLGASTAVMAVSLALFVTGYPII